MCTLMNESAGQRDTDAENITEANDYCRIGSVKLTGSWRSWSVCCRVSDIRGRAQLTVDQQQPQQDAQKRASSAAVSPGRSVLGECPAPITDTWRAPSRSAIAACSGTGQA